MFPVSDPDPQALPQSVYDGGHRVRLLPKGTQKKREMAEIEKERNFALSQWMFGRETITYHA